MKQVKERVQKKKEARAGRECSHFWVIEVANGPKSNGTCKYCGETREFFNAFPTINPLRRSANPFALPELTNVEMDDDSKS